MCAGFRLLPCSRAEFAARRKRHVRNGTGIFVHVDLMSIIQRHTEFLFDGFSGFLQQTIAKIVVFGGS